MQVNNNRSSNPNFTAIRVVKATPQEIKNFSNNFKHFAGKNLMFQEKTQSPLIVITGIDKVKYAIKAIKDMFLGINYSNEAKRIYMRTRTPYSTAAAECEKMFKDNKSASLKDFLQKNNAKHISMDELIQEVQANKI